MAILGERNDTDSVPSHERNWSELREDILHLFSKKLPDISDFIRFRVVCKRWKLSALVTDPPPQLPWLLGDRHLEHSESAIIRFYCLLSGKVHTFTCPAYHDAWLEGPACRYLLASNLANSEMYLLDPLTHDQIRVPSPNVGEFYWTTEYIGPHSIEGGYIMVISGFTFMYDTTPLMAFWHLMADDWVYVEGVDNNSNAYYMGQCFCNESSGITNVIDIATKKLAYQVAPPVVRNPLLGGDTIMVESGGKILRLFQYHVDEVCNFDIYRLYFGDGEGIPCWVKITDIGDQMLFLQYNRGLSVCASNFSGFKGNCIYFLKDRRYLCRYNIGDGTTEVLPCPFDSVNSWFVPSLV